MGIFLVYFGYFFVTIGAIFLFLGALGIYRMPDLYTRLQAGTKASTLGAMSLILGVAFLEPDWWIKLIIMILFIAFSNPLSSHAIARGSYKHNLKPFSKEQIDAYEEVEESKEEQE
jgi:multicomponent Na+:H+ antiporter subunit G